MDPASAGVAFVGFGASLISLAGLLIDSAKTLHDFCNKLTNAPKELRRFVAVLNRLQLLSALLKDRTSQYKDDDLPQGLKQFWLDNVSDMKDDYDNLQKLVRRIQANFDAKSFSNKNIRARIRTFFSTEEITEFEKRLSSHIGKFDLALSLLNDARGEEHGEKLTAITEETISTRVEIGHGLTQLQTTISSHEQYLLRIAEQMSGVQRELKMMSGQPNRYGKHQASYVERQNTMQFSRRYIPVSPGATNIPQWFLQAVTETKTQGLARSYWFGVLNVRVSSQHGLHFATEGPQEQTIPETLEFTFVPPWWISDSVISISIHSSMRFGLRRHRYNPNPQIMEYVDACDKAGLENLFVQGKATPTDMIMNSDKHVSYENVIPLFEVIHGRSNVQIEDGYASNSNWAKLYQFVFEQLGQNVNYLMSIDEMLQTLMENQIQEKWEICKMLISNGADLPMALNHKYRRDFITKLTILYATGPRSFVHDLVYQNVGLEEYWAMTPANSWILRAIARSDSRFMGKLKSQVQELRYSNVAKQKANRCTLDLGIEAQLKEMQASSSRERNEYIVAICSGGTAKELKYLIDNCQKVPELDVKAYNGTHSLPYVEIAAGCRNVETFRCFHEAGVDLYHPWGHVWELVSRNGRVANYNNNISNRDQIRKEMLQKTLPPLIADDILQMIEKDTCDISVSRLSWWLEGKCWRAFNWIAPTYAPVYLQPEALRLLIDSFHAEQDDAIRWILVEAMICNDYRTRNGYTPLLEAIALGLPNVVRILLTTGADLFLKAGTGPSVADRGVEPGLISVADLSGYLQSFRSCRHEAGSCSKIELIREICGYEASHFVHKYDHREKAPEECSEVCLCPHVVEALELVEEAITPRSEKESRTINDHEKARDPGATSSPPDLFNIQKQEEVDQQIEEKTGIFQVFRLPSFLVIIGYSLSILVHVGFDILDSLTWIRRLPRATLRILALGILIWAYRWFWKSCTEYLTSYR